MCNTQCDMMVLFLTFIDLVEIFLICNMWNVIYILFDFDVLTMWSAHNYVCDVISLRDNKDIWLWLWLWIRTYFQEIIYKNPVH